MTAILVPQSDSIVRPGCTECGAATHLVGIERERPGYDLHTFQCPTCANFELAVVEAAQVVTGTREVH
jgi:hypothetical protein